MKSTMDDFFDGKIEINKMHNQTQKIQSSNPQIKSSLSDLCTQFANVLQSKVMTSTDTSCVVMKMRNLPVEVMERKSKSPLTLAAMFSYEGLDADFIALNLGETVILQEEISQFIFTLEQNGIIVSGLHNHWLFTLPQVMYVHFQSIDNPLIFAAKAARAMNILK